MTQYVLNNYKKSKLTVGALWLVYASSYFIRTCYGASIAAIVDEGMFGKGQVGLIGTVFFVCYGVGQLISGLVGDKINPFYMILFGSFAGALSCFAMSVANTLALMMIIWALNGFFQSMLWSPILRIFSETIDSGLRKNAILNVSLSLPVGTICAYLVSTVIIKFLSWKYIFVCGGFCILFAAAFVFFVFLYTKRDIQKTTVPTVRQKDEKGKSSFFSLATVSGLFIIAVPSFLHGMMRDGITNWVPTMIGETYSISPSMSVLLTILLPIFNAFGAYAVTPIYKKFRENEMKTAGFVGAIVVIPLFLLLFNGKISVFVILILLALTTSIMYALNYLIISLVPVRFSKYAATSTVSGVLNSAAHIGAAVSSYGFGAVAQKFGWTVVVLLWLVSAMMIFVFSLLSNKKWKKFIRK